MVITYIFYYTFKENVATGNLIYSNIEIITVIPGLGMEYKKNIESTVIYQVYFFSCQVYTI